MSRCFMDTLVVGILSLYILIFGTIQLWMYHKYGTEIHSHALPKSKLYNIQKFMLYFVPTLCGVRIVLQLTLFDNPTIYGYMVRFRINK